MNDIDHFIGGDLGLSATGDLLVDGATLTGQQRVLRRLITNPGDYPWHLEYGAGLPREVGALTDVPRLTSLIRSQILLEAAVARTPDPIVQVTPIQSGVTVKVQYTDAETGENVSLNFDVNR